MICHPKKMPTSRWPHRAAARGRRRRSRIPLILFLLTCLSTFWVGITDWQPTWELSRLFSGATTAGSVDWMLLRRLLVRNWDQGLIYMCAVLAILLVHEMGHFVMTLGVPDSGDGPHFSAVPLQSHRDSGCRDRHGGNPG